mmetsp:Transcript_16040/g.38273  ORF Transcript_16040/g.38273 Transcript_16040/m.38273 type:complete len:114 (-) Transcript_16040:71-412(-)
MTRCFERSQPFRARRRVDSLVVCEDKPLYLAIRPLRACESLILQATFSFSTTTIQQAAHQGEPGVGGGVLRGCWLCSNGCHLSIISPREGGTDFSLEGGSKESVKRRLSRASR